MPLVEFEPLNPNDKVIDRIRVLGENLLRLKEFVANWRTTGRRVRTVNKGYLEDELVCVYDSSPIKEGYTLTFLKNPWLELLNDFITQVGAVLFDPQYFEKDEDEREEIVFIPYDLTNEKHRERFKEIVSENVPKLWELYEELEFEQPPTAFEQTVNELRQLNNVQYVDYLVEKIEGGTPATTQTLPTTRTYHVRGFYPIVFEKLRNTREHYRFTLILPDFFNMTPLERPTVKTFFLDNLNPYNILDIVNYFVFYLVVQTFTTTDLFGLALISENDIFTVDWYKENIADYYRNEPIENIVSALAELRSIFPSMGFLLNTIRRYFNFVLGDQGGDLYKALIQLAKEEDNTVDPKAEVLDYLRRRLKFPVVKYFLVSSTTTTYDELDNSDVSQVSGTALDAVYQRGLTTVRTITKRFSLDTTHGNIESDNISQIRFDSKFLVVKPQGDVVLRDENGFILYYVLLTDGSYTIVSEKDLADYVSQNYDNILNYFPLRGFIQNPDLEVYNTITSVSVRYTLRKTFTTKGYGNFNPALISNLLQNTNISGASYSYHNGKFVYSEQKTIYYNISISDRV